MKSKKTTKRLHKSKKLEATKPLGRANVQDIPIVKVIDKSSSDLLLNK
jgi:hypothetical protein